MDDVAGNLCLALGSGSIKTLVGQCRLTLSKPALKAPLVSVLEARI